MMTVCSLYYSKSLCSPQPASHSTYSRFPLHELVVDQSEQTRSQREAARAANNGWDTHSAKVRRYIPAVEEREESKSKWPPPPPFKTLTTGEKLRLDWPTNYTHSPEIRSMIEEAEDQWLLFFWACVSSPLLAAGWTIETRWIVADTGWNNRTNFQQRPKGGIKEDHSEFRGNERKQRVMAFKGGGGVVGDEGQLEQSKSLRG